MGSRTWISRSGLNKGLTPSFGVGSIEIRECSQYLLCMKFRSALALAFFFSVLASHRAFTGDEVFLMAAPTYAEIRERVFQPMCSRCHGPNGPAYLHFYDERTTYFASDQIIRAMESRSMPPRRRMPQPTEDDLKAVRAWYDALPDRWPGDESEKN